MKTVVSCIPKVRYIQLKQKSSLRSMFTTNTDKISPHLKILSHETLHLSVLSQNDD